MSNKGDCVEEVSNELDILLKWCDAAICLSQQAEDVAAIQNFLAKKLLVLLNTRNIKTAKSVMSDYKDVVHDEVGQTKFSLEVQESVSLNDFSRIPFSSPSWCERRFWIKTWQPLKSC